MRDRHGSAPDWLRIGSGFDPFRSGRQALQIAPHDCRRTFARLASSGQAPLEQIQLALRQQSIQMTQRYLGFELDLTDAARDRLRIRL
jgi:integrase